MSISSVRVRIQNCLVCSLLTPLPRDQQVLIWKGMSEVLCSMLEGDGVLPNLYYFLWCRKVTAAPGFGTDLRIPSTVIFEHNFPKAWYYINEKNRCHGAEAWQGHRLSSDPC